MKRARPRVSGVKVLIAAAIVLGVVRLLPLSPGSQPGSSAPPSTGSITAVVTRAVDGDTIKVRSREGRRFTVRLLGIDTPETHRPGTPIECGGPQASANMAVLTFADGRGRPVTLTTDPTQDRIDRYGRLLAYVRLDHGPLLESAQLRAGWATVYVYHRHPVERFGQFEADQQSARGAGRGVWARCGGDFHSAGGGRAH